MFRKKRTSSASASTSPTPAQGANNGSSSDADAEDFEVINAPSPSRSRSGEGSSSGPTRSKAPTSPSPIIPLQSSSSGDRHRGRDLGTDTPDYPSWLPRRPPPPAPPSSGPGTRAGSAASNWVSAGLPVTGRIVSAPGRHRVSESYDTGYTAGTGYNAGTEGEIDPELELEGEEVVGGYIEEVGAPEDGALGLGRRQTSRSVRIVSVPSGRRAATATGPGSKRDRRRRYGHGQRRTSDTVVADVGRRENRGHRRTNSHGMDHPGAGSWWRSSLGVGGMETIPSTPVVFGRGYMPPNSANPLLQHQPFAQRALLQQARARQALMRRPRFNAPGLKTTHILPAEGSAVNAWMRLWWVFWPALVVVGPVLVQTYLDFNAVFCLFEIALHPTPASEATTSTSNPASSRNWALGAAAYVICWVAWVIGVIFLYEIVYGFVRRWRVKRPLMLPLFLSASAYNLVCMTSYANFCFMQHVRYTACPPTRFFRWFGTGSSGSSVSGASASANGGTQTPSEVRRSHADESGRDEATSVEPELPEQSSRIARPPTPNILLTSRYYAPSSSARSISPSLASWPDFIAETCFFYSQNLPTVALLLPRAALCLALLLAYSKPQPGDVVLANEGLMQRDSTFFGDDGQLSGYAQAVLWVIVGMCGWRTAVLLASWLGLWILSGQACAGLCGPRYRWEEPEEKTAALGYYQDGGDEEAFDVDEDGPGVAAAWGWRECTRLRVQDAYELCLSIPPASSARPGEPTKEKEEPPFEGLDRVLAAVGLPTSPLPARRGVLSGQLFETPPLSQRELEPEEGLPTPPPPVPGSRAGSKKGSKDSRKGTKSGEATPRSKGSGSGSKYAFKGYPAQASSMDVPLEKIPFPPSPTIDEHKKSEDVHEEVTVEEEEVEGDDDEEYDDYEVGIEEPSASSGRASGSMSSLGQSIPSRFPFQFRQVPRPRKSRGGRSSVGTAQSKSASSASASASMQTGSTPDRSVQQHHRQASSMAASSDSPWSQSQAQSPSSGIPSPSSMGHPGSAGSPLSSSPIPMPPSGRQRHRTRRDRASMPSMPVTALGDISAGIEYSEVESPRIIGRARSRTFSSGTGAGEDTFGPHPVYESSEEDATVGVEEPAEGEDVADEDDDLGMMTDPEPEGSQEEAEREDSVGLLSGGPSPRSSMGALRSRSNLSLTNLTLGLPPIGSRVRSRHSSASSQSYGRSLSVSGSGSASHHSSDGPGHGLGPASARSRSLSAQARSRTHSLIQSIGAASMSSISFELSGRSRSNSMAPVAEGVASAATPERGRLGSGAESALSSSGSGSSNGSVNNPEFTFGQRIKLRLDAPEGERTVEGQGMATREDPEKPLELREDDDPTDGPMSNITTTQVQPPNSPTQSVPVAGGRSLGRPLQVERSFISSANESFVTGPATQEGSSDTTGRSPESYGTMQYGHEHAAGPSVGGWRPS